MHPRVAVASLLIGLAIAVLDEDATDALLQDSCASGSCALELLQAHGRIAAAESRKNSTAHQKSNTAHCKHYVKCDASNKHQGQPCEKGYYCSKTFSAPTRTCLHWVNCARSCYCANWAQLLEQGSEISRLENVEVRFQDEDIEHPTTEVAETATSTKCKQYVKCDASNEYNGQPCNKGYICEKWGNGPQCLHWVNCIHQCYCKSWANLLEQASEENEANVRFDDADVLDA